MDTTISSYNVSNNIVNTTEFETDNGNKTSTPPPSNLDRSAADILQDKMNLVQYIGCPTLLVLGLLGNVSVVLTVSHQKFRHMTSRYILCALAFSDSLLLLTNPFNQQFMLHLWGQDVRALSVTSCKLFFVMYRTGKMTASWMIVLVAIERFVAVLFPLKAKLLLQKWTVLTAIGFMYIFILIITGSWTFSTNIKDSRCLPDVPTVEQKSLHKTFLIVAAVFYSLAPLVFLIILTPPIIIKLVSSQNMRQSMYQSNITRVSRDTSRVSVMLVGVVCSYIVWVTPITIVLVHTFWTNEPIFSTKKSEDIILTGVALLFEQINHSSNFAIYIMCSRQFRSRFLMMVKCGNSRNEATTANSSSGPPTYDLSSTNGVDTSSVVYNN